jgi:hypothetical protein
MNEGSYPKEHPEMLERLLPNRAIRPTVSDDDTLGFVEVLPEHELKLNLPVMTKEQLTESISEMMGKMDVAMGKQPRILVIDSLSAQASRICEALAASEYADRARIVMSDDKLPVISDGVLLNSISGVADLRLPPSKFYDDSPEETTPITYSPATTWKKPYPPPKGRRNVKYRR